MLGIIRRVFSFVDWERHHPNVPPPGDMLDASFDAQNKRILELETLVSQILRSDGVLQNGTVSIDSLTPEFRGKFNKEITDATQSVADRVLSLMEMAELAAFQAIEAAGTAKQAHAKAEIAKGEVEAAKSTAIAEINATNANVVNPLVLGPEVRTDWDDAEQEAHAWAEASQMWAEYMPSTIPDDSMVTMGITGDHWSARWWANQAAGAFGMLTSLYLGVSATPPATNANGGPIAVGSIYYNSTTQQPYVWTGSQWESFVQPQKASLLTLWYTATASQTAFPMTTADLYGKTYTMSTTVPEGIEVHVNGLLKRLTADYTVTPASSTITRTAPSTVGDLVAINVMMPNAALGPGAVQNWQLKPLVGINGSTVTFTGLQTLDGAGPTVTIGKNEDLVVSVDGIIQQPTTSYSATGSQITFVTAPSADSYVFIVWQRPLPLTGAVGEAPIDSQIYGRRNAAWTIVTGGGGSDTAAQILAKLITVDGAGSLLDADLLDAQSGSYYLDRTNHTGLQAIATVTNLQTSLDAKAPLASPVLTGDPQVPTPALADFDKSIANTEWVKNQGYISPDVAMDGKQYARKNGAWAEVVASSGGVVHNYQFNSTVAAPPSSGTLRFNNATQTAVTTIWLNYTNFDSVNLKTYFLQKVRVGDTFYVQDRDDATKWVLYTLNADFTDSGTYATMPVTWTAGGSTVTAARVIVVREGASVASPIGEAPLDAKLYGRESGQWVQTAKVTVASSAPGTPDTGDVWIDTT